jgi:hypothetical protein
MSSNLNSCFGDMSQLLFDVKDDVEADVEELSFVKLFHRIFMESSY